MSLKIVYAILVCTTQVYTTIFPEIGYDKTFHSGVAEKSLVLSHVVFRHGDRTPDGLSIFPIIPYVNETYSPYGPGQLTLEGKKRAFAMGKQLYNRYKNFLGPIYNPENVEAIASETTRTHMSLQSALASLFPPTKQYRLSHIFDWQPIPYTYLKYEVDKMINTVMTCSYNYIEAYEKSQNLSDENRKLYDYLSVHLEHNITSLLHIINIQDTILTNLEFGNILPKWAKPIWPNILTNAAEQFWQLLANKFSTNVGGYLFKKIVDDTNAKLNNTDALRNRKLILYSGHDITVTGILGILGNFQKRPPYSSYVLIELHQIAGTYGIKAFYQDYSQFYPRLLTIPNCGVFCSWNKFISLTQHYLPDDNWCKPK